MKPPLRYLSEACEQWLRAWWNALQQESWWEKKLPQEVCILGHGDRARLRRARSIEELETERAANLLVAHLLKEEWKNNLAKSRFEADPSALLMVAGLLATVKADLADGRSLARRVGANSTTSDTSALMSEMRFKRLLQARSLDEFFLLARRAVQLADGSVDVAVLADDLLVWAYEQEFSAGIPRPAKSLRFRWAQDYYQPLKDRDAAWTAPEETHEGEMA